MSSVLISTVYEKFDSTKLSILSFKGIRKIFLLLDKESKERQLESIQLIKKLFGNEIDIVEKKIDLYDIKSISRDVIEIIDSIPENDEIYVDISQGKKSQAFGVLFACYSRLNRIEEIVYWVDDKKMLILPKLSFDITADSKRILQFIEHKEDVTKLIGPNISKSKLYRLIKRLEEKKLMQKMDGKYILTDAGKIAIL